MNNVIHTDRFDASRIERGQIEAERKAFLRDVNASYPEQLEATRGPDPMGDDLVTVIATLVVGSLIVMAVIWGIVS